MTRVMEDSDATTCEPEWVMGPEQLSSGDEADSHTNVEDEEERKENSPLQKDCGFDDVFFERPRFPHSSSHPKKPFILSPPDTTPPIQVPAVLNRYLRDYQQQGVQFLYSHYTRGTGAVLCDDMGLGKTVQVIAFMCALLGKSNTKADLILESPRQVCDRGCFLVVCPGSVLYNWTTEIETWSHLKYAVYHRERKEEALDKVRRQRVEVLLSTPDTVRTHVDSLNSVNWLAVFCDEVQVIKGLQSQVTTAMNRLNVKRRYGLTGTALQNNLTELWSILSWANPGCLKSLSSFQTQFEKPILVGQKFDCTKRQLAEGRRKQLELEQKMKQWVLRRTKSLIASQLPKKDEIVLFCSLTELQESIYRSLLDCEDVQLILHSEEPCDCYSGKKRGNCCYQRNKEGTHWSKLFVEYICLFTKCANHLGLLLPGSTQSTQQREKSRRACEEAFSKCPQFLEVSRQASFLTLSDPKYCGKMQVLQRLLMKFHKERDKAIIFSHSTKLLDIVQDYVVSMGYTHCRLDGSTRIEERAKLVQSFNSDPTVFIFLISKKCGGVGLNLTGANRVIIYDPSWNPATDQQAEDRAFRIGQSRDVKVFRLVTEGSVEEMIYLRQVYKQQLASMTLEGNRERRYFTGVAGDHHQKGELFGCANLLQLRKPGSNLTFDILKRADQMEAGVRQGPNLLAVAELKSPSHACSSSNSESQLPGTTAIMHSGCGAVVGNSRVEEHISRQATSDVYHLQQHSQQPANVVENKLEEFSDESDDIGSPSPPKRNCTVSRSHVDVSVPINMTSDVHTKSPTPEASQERPAQQVERATRDRRSWESVIFSQHTPERLSRPSLESHSRAASLAASSIDLFATEDTVTYSYSKQPRPTRQPTHTACSDAKYVPFVPVDIEELFG